MFIITFMENMQTFQKHKIFSKILFHDRSAVEQVFQRKGIVNPYIAKNISYWFHDIFNVCYNFSFNRALWAYLWIQPGDLAPVFHPSGQSKIAQNYHTGKEGFNCPVCRAFTEQSQVKTNFLLCELQKVLTNGAYQTFGNCQFKMRLNTNGAQI